MCYTIKWSDRGVIWTYAGVLTGNALIESNLAIYNDPRFETIDYQIVDLRGVEEFRVLSQHMEKVAALDVAASKLNSHIRVAVVSPVVTGRHMTRTYTKIRRITGKRKSLTIMPLPTNGRRRSWPRTNSKGSVPNGTKLRC